MSPLSSSSSLTRQQRPQPSHRLSHSAWVISASRLRCQNGASLSATRISCDGVLRPCGPGCETILPAESCAPAFAAYIAVDRTGFGDEDQGCRARGGGRRLLGGGACHSGLRDRRGDLRGTAAEFI